MIRFTIRTSATILTTRPITGCAIARGAQVLSRTAGGGGGAGLSDLLGVRFIFYFDPKLAAGIIPLIDGRIGLIAGRSSRGTACGPFRWIREPRREGRGGGRPGDARGSLPARSHREAGRRLFLHGAPVVIVVYAGSRRRRPRMRSRSARGAAFARDEIPWTELAFRSVADGLRDYLKLS